MADRTSAALFADIFKMFASYDQTKLSPPAAVYRAKMILWLWKRSEQYDFHPCQMDIPETLEKLGLLRRKPDPKSDTEDGMTWKYGPEKKEESKMNADDLKRLNMALVAAFGNNAPATVLYPDGSMIRVLVYTVRRDDDDASYVVARGTDDFSQDKDFGKVIDALIADLKARRM